jgi:hypothetical protein
MAHGRCFIPSSLTSPILPLTSPITNNERRRISSITTVECHSQSLSLFPIFSDTPEFFYRSWRCTIVRPILSWSSRFGFFGLVGFDGWDLGTRLESMFLLGSLVRYCRRQYFKDNDLDSGGLSRRLVCIDCQFDHFLGMDHHGVHPIACDSVGHSLENDS